MLATRPSSPLVRARALVLLALLTSSTALAQETAASERSADHASAGATAVSETVADDTTVAAPGSARPDWLAQRALPPGLPALVPEAIQSVPARHEPATEEIGAPPRFGAHFQATYVLQRKAGFEAPYTGPNSLVTDPETGFTLTSTLFVGARLWDGAEVFVNPETIQALNISHMSGLGGLSNGENQKGGGVTPLLYVARAFVRQSIALGGTVSTIETGQNQLWNQSASRRVVITAGKFSWADVFETSTFAHDPRTQFLNWSLMTHGALDYAADVRGYTWGISVEYDHDEWAFRAARMAQPIESNGVDMDFNLLKHYGDTIEVEHGHTLFGQAGKIRLIGVHNRANMGAFADATSLAAAHGGTPSVADVRRDQSKFGFGVSVEQVLLPELGAFARYSYNDGRTETYAFAEIERSLNVGLSASGKAWGRGGDTAALAWSMNGISEDHQRYLAGGGLGFLIGDGRLDRYRPEQIVEGYYSFDAYGGLWVTADAQYIWNPAYNADRGPVGIVSVRFHAEY